MIKAMSSETRLTGHERLHNIVVSLGMEITDSILSALRNEIIACRQEQKEQLIFVDPILISIDAVVRHIDEMRVLTDARAFSLLNDLVSVYRRITVDTADVVDLVGQEACQAVVSECLTKVFSWQHNYARDIYARDIRAGVHTAQETTPTPAPAPAPISASGVNADMKNIKDLLDTVQQEITATGMMAIRESAALLELVHVQNEAADSFSKGFEKSEGSEETGGKIEGGEKEEFSSLIQGNISSLQQAFHQEMERLRHEIIQD